MADLDDKDILEPNTRPNEDIFDDDPPPGLTPDDNQLVDDGELAPDETTLDDQIAADREADKAAAEAKGVADDDGIVIEDAEAVVAEKKTKKEPYGKRAEKAIAKANSGKKSAESRADQAERNLAEYRQKEDDAKGQNAKSAVARHETNITQKEGDVDRLRTSLKKSQEDGEAEESARIIDEMTDAKIDIRESTYALRQAKQRSAEYDQEVEARGKGNGGADNGATGGNQQLDEAELRLVSAQYSREGRGCLRREHGRRRLPPRRLRPRTGHTGILGRSGPAPEGGDP